MKNTFGLIVLFAFAVSFDSYAQLKSDGAESGNVTRRQIIEEIIHDFEVTTYPKGRIVGGRKPVADLSPEATLDKWVDALRGLSYAEVMAFWDEAARAKQNSESQKVGKTESQWESDWRRLLKGQSVMYQTKLVYGPYVVFDLEFRDLEGKTTYRELIAMKRLQQEWKLTRELADSVVLQHWNSSQSRVRRLAAPLYKKADGR